MVAIIIFLTAGLNNELTITGYCLYSNKINSPIRIVLLADLHSCYYGDSESELIDAINKQNPDVIMMAGDIADDVLPEDNVKTLLEGIGNKYPCYYVAGNHEFWSGRVEEQKAMFTSYGVNVLQGTCETISLNGQSISVCGVDDPDGGLVNFNSQLSTVGKSICKDQYSILLAHRPELLADYSQHSFDLVLSGHAHGGQWRIPFIFSNGLFAPNQGLFPKYTKGIHEYVDTTMIISRGLSRESTRIPRFYNPPEVVTIDLLPVSNKSFASTEN